MIGFLVTLAFTVTTAFSITPKCEPLDKDIACHCPGYNQTYYPNDRFTSQGGAKRQFAEFKNLIGSNCSPHLVSFLCSRYFPPCNTQWSFKYIHPCRELCFEVKRDCGPTLQGYGTSWPDELECAQFKSYHPSHPCVSNETSLTTNTGAKCSAKESCVNITHSKAKSLHANYKTYYPNGVFKSSDDADKKFEDALKGGQWSAEVERFFFLSHYLPCNETDNKVQLLSPCRHLCRRVKRNFESQQNGKDVAWPDHLDCATFPRSNCIDDDSSYFSEPPPTVKTCKEVVESSCGILNTLPGLPSVKFPEDNTTFVKYAKFLDSGCSQWLKPFLCYEAFSAHHIGNPGQRVRPCRNICRKAQTECSSCFKQHGLTWDDLWNCSKDFQVKGDCIGLKDLDTYQPFMSESPDSPVCPPTVDDSTCY